MKQPSHTHIFVAAYLLTSLILGIWLRVPHWNTLADKWVLGTDSMRFVRQAELILERGSLPERDLQRSHPIGHITRHSNLFPHFLARTYQVFGLFFLQLSLQQLAIIYPVVLMVFAWGCFTILVWRMVGLTCALLASNLFLLAPPICYRTLAGFADRDALVLALALAGYCLYILPHQLPKKRFALLFSLFSGFAFAGIALVWPGVGLLSIVIVVHQGALVIFEHYNSRRLLAYSSWIAGYLTGLLMLFSLYHEIHKPFVFLAVAPPLYFLAAAASYLFLRRFQRGTAIMSLRGLVPAGVGCIFLHGIVLASALLICTSIHPSLKEIPAKFIDHFLSPFGTNRLSLSIGELNKDISDWLTWPGYLFFLVAAGALFLTHRFAQSCQINVWLSLLLMEILLAGVVLTFLLAQVFPANSSITLYVYFTSLGILSVGVVLLVTHAFRQGQFNPQSQLGAELLFVLIWFTVMLVAARQTLRFDLFLAPVAVLMASYGVVQLFQRYIRISSVPLIHILLASLIVWQFCALGFQFDLSIGTMARLTVGILASLGLLWFGIRVSKPILNRLRTGITYVGFLSLLLLLTGIAPFPWLGGYVQWNFENALAAAPLANPSQRQAMRWLADNTPAEAVVATWWDYGSRINWIANRTTIVDEEQNAYWVHNMARHLIFAQTEEEALSYLRTHGATHVLFSLEDIPKLGLISLLGADAQYDRRCVMPVFVSAKDVIVPHDETWHIHRFQLGHQEPSTGGILTLDGKNYPEGHWHIQNIYLRVVKSEGIPKYIPTAAFIELIVEGKQTLVRPAEIYSKDQRFQQHNSNSADVILVFSESDNPFEWRVIWVPAVARNSFFFERWLFESNSPYFQQVYPPIAKSVSSTNSETRIWEIHYPDHIQGVTEYLKVDFPDKVLAEAWKHDY